VGLHGGQDEPVGVGGERAERQRESAYPPGPIRTPGAAVQVTDVTASVTVRPCRSSGGSSGARVSVAVQPGRGVVRTDVIGCSAGSVTRRATVPAVSDSVGTRKVTTP
jgi:hypothetical protein